LQFDGEGGYFFREMDNDANEVCAIEFVNCKPIQTVCTSKGIVVGCRTRASAWRTKGIAKEIGIVGSTDGRCRRLIDLSHRFASNEKQKNPAKT
jgi:hypothetical protein